MTRRQLRELLMDCADKLLRYREQHNGAYVGGVEYTELQRRIVAALDALPPDNSLPVTGEQHGK